MFKLTIYVKSVLQLLGIALLAWLIYLLRGLLIYVLVAALLALVTKPITNWLSTRKIAGKALPRGLSAALTLVSLIAFLSFLGTILLPPLFAEFAFLQEIDVEGTYQSFLTEIEVAQKWLANYNVELGNVEEGVRRAVQNFFSIETAEATISALLGGLGNLAIALFSIIFILFFFLKEKGLSEYLTDNFLDEPLSQHIKNILPKIKNTLFRYAIGLSLQMMGVFTLVYVGLRIVEVPSALVIAVFAAVMNLIPYVGPLIGSVAGIIIGVGQAYFLTPEISLGLYASQITLVFAITQLIDNFVYEPLIFSNSIKAHPLEVFLVISIAGLLGGIFGMIIAVPAYGMVRIISKEFLSQSKFIQGLTKNV